MMKAVLVLFFSIFLLHCKSDQSTLSPPVGTALGKIDSRLSEASGLVASINNPGFLWTINDSGNTAEVFLIDRQAKVRMVCSLKNVENRDWEDLAIDQNADGKNYLYIADIGDNEAQYDDKIIYRFEEPRLSDNEKLVISKFEVLTFKLEDGRRDAETILIDPTSHDLFIISKREHQVLLYKAPRILGADTMQFEKMIALPFNQIVGGSISSDGRKVLLKNYTNIYYWEKSGEESILSLLSTPPVSLPYHREPQGESITWSRDGHEFFTLSESHWTGPASLIVYTLKPIEQVSNR